MIQTSATHPIYLTDMIQLPSLLPFSDTVILLITSLSVGYRMGIPQLHEHYATLRLLSIKERLELK